MNRPDPWIKGIALLALFWGLGAVETSAQVAGPFARPSGRSSVPSRYPFYPTAPSPNPATATRDNQVRRTQDAPPPPPTTTPLGNVSGPVTPEVTPPPVTEPGAANTNPNPETEPTVNNAEDLSAPKAEKEGGGGEPTEEKAAEEKAAAPETTLLMRALGMEDSPVKVYGWIQNSFTANAWGTPKNDLNFGVNPNFEANRWMGNQYYLIFENPLEQNDTVNFGFRLDNLFGNDWQFNHARGLFERSFKLNHFAGYDPAQLYGEVHLPILTKGGLDVKGGRFYTILGYEVVPAIGRPLLSVPYMFNYGQPFTHTGFLSTLHVTDRVNWFNGAVNGYDRWLDTHWKWNYLGGWTWTSKDGKANFAQSYIFGPNQYPWFLRNQPNLIVLLGNTIPPYLAGRHNPNYGGNWRGSFTNVFSYKWSDKLTQVVENDDSWETNIPGSGYGGTSNNNSWYGLANWFLYSFTDKFTGVWRSEVFRDNGGQRTQNGFGDNYYEITLGGIWKPKSWLWIRPEIRWDWAQFTHPFIDGTKNHQLTFGGDVIFLF